MLQIIQRCREQYEFHLIVPGDGPFAVRARAIGASVSYLPWPRRFGEVGERNKKLAPATVLWAAFVVPALVWRLRRLLCKINPDVVITNGLKAHMIGSFAVTKRRSRLIWYLREGLEGRSFGVKILRALKFRCDSQIAISEYVAQDASSILGLKQAAIQVAYNIVDLSEFRPGVPRSVDLPKKVQGEVWFGVVGALTPLKGQDLFLNAAEEVLKYVPNCRFLIVGSNFYETEGNDYEQKLKHLAESPSLHSRVHFLGFREDIPSVMAALDVVVQCNRGPEGLGRSVLEAMACGVPVLAVDKWGPAELIQDGHTGLLFPHMNTVEFARQMIRLALEAPLRKTLAANALQWIGANLEPQLLADKVSAVIRAQLNNARS